MPRVFSSHSALDRQSVEAGIIEPLQANSIDTWYSTDEIVGGEQWQKSILEGIEKCQWFLVALSPSSVSSDWVKAEVELAFRRLTPGHIVPVVLKACDSSQCHVKLPLLHHIDFRSDKEKALGRLVAIFSEKSAKPSRVQEKGDDARQALSELDAIDEHCTAQQVLRLFRHLRHENEEVPPQALKTIRRIGWDVVDRRLEEIARRGDSEELAIVLDGLAGIEGHRRVVEAVEALIPNLSGALRNRAVLLAERKQLSLEFKTLAEVFQEQNSPIELKKVLGQGLFASSLLAHNTRTGLDLVVRVLRKELAVNARVRAEFTDRMRRATHYVHEHLVLCRDVGDYPRAGLYYCLRDFVEGNTLQDALNANEGLSLSESVEVAHQVVRALEPIHRASETHLNIKPSNIFVCKRGDTAHIVLGEPSLPVWLIDSGLERLLYDYCYVAPEVFLQKPVPQSDFYSLGCVLFQLAYGAPPFAANTPFELASLHLKGNLAEPAGKAPNLPDSFRNLLRQLLDREPSRRPQSTAEVLAVLTTLDQERTFRPQARQKRLDDTTFQEKINPEYSILMYADTSSKLMPDTATDSAPPAPETEEQPDASGPPPRRDALVRTAEGMAPPGVDAPAERSESRTRLEDTTKLDLADLTESSATISTTVPGDAFDDPLIGAHLDNIEVLSLLGQGGFGKVYRGRDVRLDRTVAVKVLRDMLEPRHRQLFEREAQAIAALGNHPNIVVIYAWGEFKGHSYFVLQFVETSARQLLQDRQGGLPVREALRIALQAAEALSYAHGHGIIHRDIKPGNILIEPKSGQAKLADFGMARVFEAPDQESTLGGAISGSPPYMSPEQIQGEPLDARSDIFSLGVTLYELLSGGRPFEGHSALDVLHRVRTDDRIPLSRRLPGLPRSVLEIVNKATAHKPADRYQTAKELAAELRACLEHLEHIESGPPLSVPSRERKQMGFGLLVAAIAVTALVFSLAQMLTTCLSVE